MAAHDLSKPFKPLGIYNNRSYLWTFGMEKPRNLPRFDTEQHLEQRLGRVVTFYSYKGGVGRTSTLAYVAVELAKQGHKVLIVDFDLEAPGLQYYFSDSLSQDTIRDSEGVIDLLWMHASRVGKGRATVNLNWRSCLQRILLDDADTGSVDFIGPGRFDDSYVTRVTSFDWKQFYEGARGDLFLDELLREWKVSYDFVLVDSRSGISDISGICTIHLSDVVAMMFTYNQQSVNGALFVAECIVGQREGIPNVPIPIIFPIPGRVEAAGSQLFNEARDHAKEVFSGFPQHLSDEEREEYWSSIEIPNSAQCYFSKGLARDIAPDDSTLLECFRVLGAHLSSPLSSQRKTAVKERAADYTYDIALSFAGPDRQHAEKLADFLTSNGVRVFYDAYEEATLWGKDLYEYLADIYSNRARYFVAFLSEHYAERFWTNHERKHAQARAFRENEEYILPVRLDDTDIPGVTKTIAYIDLREKSINDVGRLLMHKLKRDRPKGLKNTRTVPNNAVNRSGGSCGI